MTLVDVILALVLLVILGLSIGYVVRAKRRGKRCIGCPHADSCPSQTRGCTCQTPPSEK